MTQRQDPDLDLLEAIYDALDDGDAARALQLAQASLAESGDQDPVIRFLAGVALMELDQPEQAVESLRLACDMDPGDAEFRANLALARYRACRFAEALADARAALDLDDSLPDAHCVLGLLLERANEVADAEASFGRAAKLDPERFPAPLRLGEDEFRLHVERARTKLDEEFLRHLDQVAVTVEPLPSDDVLHEEEPPLDPELFGLFVGVPLTGRSAFSPGGELPPRILLFQRNLERCFPERNVLEQQIAITLYHELGHYLGMDEEELLAIDLD
jgi:predicted Zn-dependent protease with MMP-like domain